MKVFISVPMRGYTDEEIENNINRMIEISKILLKDKSRPIFVDNFHSAIEHGLPKVAENNKHKNLYYLGHALQILADCDYIVRPLDIWGYTGCVIEKEAAEFYGITQVPIDNRWLYLHDGESIEFDNTLIKKEE